MLKSNRPFSISYIVNKWWERDLSIFQSEYMGLLPVCLSCYWFVVIYPMRAGDISLLWGLYRLSTTTTYVTSLSLECRQNASFEANYRDLFYSVLISSLFKVTRATLKWFTAEIWTRLLLLIDRQVDWTLQRSMATWPRWKVYCAVTLMSICLIRYIFIYRHRCCLAAL